MSGASEGLLHTRSCLGEKKYFQRSVTSARTIFARKGNRRLGTGRQGRGKIGGNQPEKKRETV